MASRTRERWAVAVLQRCRGRPPTPLQRVERASQYSMYSRSASSMSEICQPYARETSGIWRPAGVECRARGKRKVQRQCLAPGSGHLLLDSQRRHRIRRYRVVCSARRYCHGWNRQGRTGHGMIGHRVVFDGVVDGSEEDIPYALLVTMLSCSVLCLALASPMSETRSLDMV
jgi:hypothetical protein